MQNVTPDMLWTFVLVLAAVCGFALTVTGLVKNIRDLRKPSKQREDERDAEFRRYFDNDKRHIEEAERRLSSVEKRLTPLEESEKEQSLDIQVLMSGVLALLDHELHNGNEDQMRDARKQIETRLIKRR